MNVDEIPNSQYTQFLKKLKTKYVKEYLNDLKKGAKPELGALREAFFTKHNTFLSLLLGIDYNITPEVNIYRTFPDIYIVKRDFEIKVEIELKKLFFFDKKSNKLIKSELKIESHEQEIRKYLEGAPYVILTNLEKWYIYTYKNFLKTGDINPVKEWDFDVFTKNVQEMGFFEFILRETIEKREELGAEFFKALNSWLELLEKNVKIKNEFEEQKSEIFIQLINKLIFIQTLSDFALIDFKFLETAWKFWDSMYGVRDKKKVVKNFINLLVNEFHYTFYNTELFNFSLIDKIEDTIVNYENLYFAIREILGIKSLIPSSNSFSGLMSYPYILIDEDIFGRSYEIYLVKKRKEEGIYYTPNLIRKKIIKETVQKIFDNLKEEIFKILNSKSLIKKELNQLEYLLKNLTSIRILDPACGSGSFLINTLDVIWNCYQDIFKKAKTIELNLVKKFKSQPLKYSTDPLYNACVKIKDALIRNERDRISKIILRHIFGKDIDKNALNVAKVNIWLKALKLAPSKFKKSELEKDIKNEHILPNLETNLVKGNSLIGISYDDFISFFNEKINIFNSTIFNQSFYEKNIKTLPKDIKEEVDNEVNKLKSKSGVVIKDVIDFSIFLRNQYIENVHNPEILDLLLVFKKILKKFYDDKFLAILKNRKLDTQKFTDLNISHWYLEFCNVFFETTDAGFDYIIGNPPYVFTKYKDLDKNEKDFYKEDYYDKYTVSGLGDRKIQSGKLNLFCLFLIKSLKLLKNKGILGFIVPNGILRATTNDIDREMILDSSKILKIIDLGERVFEGVTLSTILFFLQKESDKDERNNNVVEIEDLNNFKNKIIQEIFLDNVSKVFCIYLTPELDKIFRKINQTSVNLEIYIKEFVEGIVCEKSDYDYEMNINIADPSKNWKPFLKGRDINRFEIVYRNRYINYVPAKLHRSREEWIFLEPQKIISQRITGGKNVLVAALDENQYYTFASFNNFIKKKHFTYDYYYFLGLLNSYFLNCYYRINYTNNSTLTVNISKTFLEHLPIYRINFQDKRDKDLYDVIIKMSKDIGDKKKIRLDMLSQFDKLLGHKKMEDQISLNNIYNKSALNLYKIDITNSEEFNTDKECVIKEYQVNLLTNDYILILYRDKDSISFKPLLKLKFLDPLIKEYFFFSLNKDTLKKKTYRSQKNAFNTVQNDLFLRVDKKKNEIVNVKQMNDIITDLRSQYKVNLTDLNAEIKKLEISLNNAIFNLYKLTPSEIKTIRSN